MGFLRKKTETNVNYSFGKTDDEDRLAPIRVDSGEYKGTVFRYSEIKLQEDAKGPMIKFGCDIDLMMRNGDISEVEIFDLPRFYETVAKEILQDITKEIAGDSK